MLQIFRKRKPTARELLAEPLKATEDVWAKRKVSDLLISVSSVASTDDLYLISVTNTGLHVFKDLRISYEGLLLDAEHFGLDTTHMPSELARVSGEPLLIPTLAPGQSVQQTRKGYDKHERYDGPNESSLELEYRSEGASFGPEDRRWASVIVDLPNARAT